MLYTTNKCNSRCKHCAIWQKTEQDVLSLRQIKELVQDRAISPDTSIGLEGGEFLLHKEAEAILAYLSEHHSNYHVLSNGLQSKRMIQLMKRYQPKRLYLSLDGPRKTYERIRGVDGYNAVIKTIEGVKDCVPVSIMFTLTPWNDFSDLQHVMAICKKYDLDLRVGIYSEMEYFDTNTCPSNNFMQRYIPSEIPTALKDFPENYDFLSLYVPYRNGDLQLKCYSIKDSVVIYPNGDVPLCQQKHIVLGNINNNSLFQIINSPKAIELQKQHQKGCNACWINFHRKYDVVLYRNVEKLLGRTITRKMLGQYQWHPEKSKNSYRRLVMA